MTANPKRSSVNKILIPEGLLRSVNDTVYAYSRRDEESDERETNDLSHIIQHPAQAVLATASHRQWSPTPDIGSTARSNSIGIGRTSSYRVRPSRQGDLNRAASVNVATLLRRNRQLGRLDSSAEVQNPRNPFSEIPPLPSHDRSSTSNLQSSEKPSSLYDQRWSPTNQLNETSHRYPSVIHDRPRPVSFAPQPDSISVRRSTYLSLQPRLSILQKVRGSTIGGTSSKATRQYRQTSIRNTFETAKSRQKALERSKVFQIIFQYAMYLLIVACVYFILIGLPLWGGVVWYIYLLFEYHLTFVGGSAVFVGLAFFYAFGPLLVLFETPAPPPPPEPELKIEKPYFPPARFIRCFEEVTPPIPPQGKPTQDGSMTTALLIPCYKSADLLPVTLEAALKVFPASSIYILANGNSPTPLDNTEEVCTKFGVNHIWIPVGSKIVAQYVGAHVVRYLFPHVLLIDDDCLLPPNFPVVTDRLRGSVKCLGYTLKSIGANRSRGTWCQQAQDLEYKLSGLQRSFAGKIGSATFPHGAIVLWDTEFLVKTFKHHPGFSVSEDWFFGHVSRILGSRITMCSSVFVETETPSSVFFAARGGARGGFGEMTVFKQRFKRWNFFFVNGCYYNLAYIFFSWRLGFREIGAKLFVFQEVYETFLYLITPIVLPISFIVRPEYSTYLFIGTLCLYLLNSIIFNEVHLRRAGQMVSRPLLIFYYMPFKLALTCVNVASCWWSLWQYAKYFAKKHPRIVEDVSAVGVVLKIEEDLEAAGFDPSLDDGGHEFGDNDFKLGTQLRRTGAVRTKRPEEEFADSEAGSKSVRRMHSQRSGTSQWSATGLAHRARRLTATAIKVEVQQDHTSTDQLSLYSQHGDAGSITDVRGPSPHSYPVRLSPDRMSPVLNRANQLTGGVLGQIHGWNPNWTVSSSVEGDMIRGYRDADVMEQVVEEELEDDELGGYSYYGV